MENGVYRVTYKVDGVATIGTMRVIDGVLTGMGPLAHINVRVGADLRAPPDLTLLPTNAPQVETRLQRLALSLQAIRVLADTAFRASYELAFEVEKARAVNADAREFLRDMRRRKAVALTDLQRSSPDWATVMRLS